MVLAVTSLNTAHSPAPMDRADAVRPVFPISIRLKAFMLVWRVSFLVLLVEALSLVFLQGKNHPFLLNSSCLEARPHSAMRSRLQPHKHMLGLGHRSGQEGSQGQGPGCWWSLLFPITHTAPPSSQPFFLPSE